MILFLCAMYILVGMFFWLLLKGEPKRIIFLWPIIFVLFVIVILALRDVQKSEEEEEKKLDSGII